MKGAMKSTEILAKELQALQQGKSWLGYNALEILDGIDYQKAQFAAFPGGNSIWQIVNHISHWREVVIEQLEKGEWLGKEVTGMDAPDKPTEAGWSQTLERFQQAFEKLRETMLSIPEEKLVQKIGKVKPGQLMFGIIQHDAFHLGQIMLLKRMLEERGNHL